MPDQNLITDINDPQRKSIASQVENVQHTIGLAQRRFSDDTLAFQTGALAYEAIRLFWYAVMSENDGHHLEDVEIAFKWLKDHAGKKCSPQS